MWKWWLIAIAAAVGLMNAARVDRTNTPVNPSENIEAHTQMPPNVAPVFHRACHNCHSERTDWPWYSTVAPMHWLLTADVYGARAYEPVQVGSLHARRADGPIDLDLRNGGEQ